MARDKVKDLNEMNPAAHEAQLGTKLDQIIKLLNNDVLRAGAHKRAGTNVTAVAVATDEAEAIALANDIKAKHNLHIASLTPHFAADTTNAVAATDASDEASLVALVNEIKGDFNGHRTHPSHVQDDAENVVAVANASDTATAIVLINDIRAKYNAHVVQVSNALNAPSLTPIDALS